MLLINFDLSHVTTILFRSGPGHPVRTDKLLTGEWEVLGSNHGKGQIFWLYKFICKNLIYSKEDLHHSLWSQNNWTRINPGCSVGNNSISKALWHIGMSLPQDLKVIP